MASAVARLLKPRVLNLVFLAGLLTAIWAGYWPSLDHVPRADQWAYLIDTRDCHTFGDLWSKSYSYNRVRAVGPGDADLFRPVLFAVLCAEKHFFGNDFRPAQAIGLILHSFVVLLLFCLLRRIALVRDSVESIPSPPVLGGRGVGVRGDSIPCNGLAALPGMLSPLTPNPSPPSTGERGAEAERSPDANSLSRSPASDDLSRSSCHASPACRLANFPWPQLLPHALTTFFALNFASMELVVWAHLHGYLLFLVFVLAALLLLTTHCLADDISPSRGRWLIAGCWALAMLAAFTYELGQFFAVMLGMALATRRRRLGRRQAALVVAACFLAILPLYQAVNRWDSAVHQADFLDERLSEQIVAKAVSIDTLEHTGRFLAFTLGQPFFPSVTGWWYQGERIHIQEPVFGWVKYVGLNPKLLLSYAIALLFISFCVAGWRRFCRDDLRRLGPLLAVPAALLGLYTAITVLGRMNLRPSHFVLCSNSYYTYIALLFSLILAFTLWQPFLRLAGRRGRLAAALLGAGLLFLSVYSSGRIHHASERLRNTYAHFHATVRALDAFVQQHHDEPDFRIAFDMRAEDPFPVTHSIPFPLALYARWIDNHEPSHVVSFPQGRLTIETAADYRRRHSTTGQLFPDLVLIGPDYNVYRWQGKYYGSLQWDDVFRPDLKDHAYVIVGATLKDVLDEVPVRYAEFKEDLGTGWCIPPRFGTAILEEDYRGFALIEAGSYYYAIPADEAPFRTDRFNGRRYTKSLVADELATLRRYVDEDVVTAARR